MKTIIDKFGLSKAILATASIYLIASSILWLQPGVESTRAKQAEYAPAYIDKLLDKNRKLLETLASHVINSPSLQNIDLSNIDIKTSPTMNTEEIIPALMQKLAHESRRLHAYRTYIWLSDADKNFISGTPSKNFDFFNQKYDQYISNRVNKQPYPSRNDFLAALVELPDQQYFRDTIIQDLEQGHWDDYESNTSLYQQRKTGVFLLKKEILDNSNNIVATLFMKLDDSDNYYLIYTDAGTELYKNYRQYINLIRFICFLFIWFLIPSWVYNDALKRGIQKPLAWALITIFSFLFGLAVYLLIRSRLTVAHTCENCRKPKPPLSEYCPYCGHQSSSAKCPSCYTPVEDNWTYCPGCRMELDNAHEHDP